MVSLTTILRTSAGERELRRSAVTRANRTRELRVLFIGRRPPTTIFLLSFVTRSRHFFGLDRVGVRGVRATPSGKTGAAGDEACAALVSKIRPCPLDKDQYAVLKTNQEKNVDKEPRQPGHESRDVNLAELRDCG